MSFKSHGAIISASMVIFWKETSILITQGINPFYAVRIFDSYVKPRVTYCMTLWFHPIKTSLDKMWWSIHKSIFGIRSYQVSNYVVRVLSNIWPPLYSIRYHGSSSSLKCHVYHLVGGRNTHPWSATKVGNPIPATNTSRPETKKNNQQTTQPSHYAVDR